MPKDRLQVQDHLAQDPSIAPLIVREPPARIVILAGIKARVRRPIFLDAPIAREAVAILQIDPPPAVPVAGMAPEIVQLEPPDDLPAAVLPFVVLQEPTKGLMPPTTDPLEEAVPQTLEFPKAVETIAGPRNRDALIARMTDLEMPAAVADIPGTNARVRTPFFLDAPIAREALPIPPEASPIPQDNPLQSAAPKIFQFEPANDLPVAILPFIVLQEPAKGLQPATPELGTERGPQTIVFPQTAETTAPPPDLEPPPAIAKLPGTNTRVRRPFFLDAPSVREAFAILQVDPSPVVAQTAVPEILQLEPPGDLPAAILPFVVLQGMPNELMSRRTDPLEDPIPQVVIYPQGNGTTTLPTADLGPPTFANP